MPIGLNKALDRIQISPVLSIGVYNLGQEYILLLGEGERKGYRKDTLLENMMKL